MTKDKVLRTAETKVEGQQSVTLLSVYTRGSGEAIAPRVSPIYLPVVCILPLI
jgi:hypothetical protein